MSVSTMKRLTVLAHRSDEDKLIKKLMKLRCLDVNTAAQSADISRKTCESAEQVSALEESTASIDKAIGALSRYAKRKKGTLGLSRSRLDLSAFAEGDEATRAREAVRDTLDVLSRQADIKKEITKRQELAAAVSPYVGYELPLGFIGTERTSALLGKLPPRLDVRSLGVQLSEIGTVSRILHSDGTGIYMSVICHSDDRERVTSLLSEYGFLSASFSDTELTAEKYRSSLLSEISELENEYEKLTQRLSELAALLDSIEALYDVEATALTAARTKEKMLSTEACIIIEGWVPSSFTDRITAVLDGFSCAYELSEPNGEDKPPVWLRNNSFAQNFEWVLGMYSYPAYGKFDPTFIMSIWYFIIFGLMFADAGYGLLLMLGGLLGARLFKASPSMERFLKMFGYCGISCVVFGILFGTYFGDLPLAFMRSFLNISEAELPTLALLGDGAANIAVLFEPLQNPMSFLLIALGIGAAQLITGMAINFVLLCREGRAADAILDVGVYWLLFVGIALIFLAPKIGKPTAIAAAVLILLTHGRKEKRITQKILKGFLGLYDLISYASDLLSYSRILALGLAAGVISQVINLLATLGGPSVGGIIMLIAVFLVGHMLNLVINVLGTFVHTARLQYIEFFNKFYEDGGVAFEPIAPSEKYTTDGE